MNIESYHAKEVNVWKLNDDRVKVSERSMITTISFDADGTLWDFPAAMQEALSRTLSKLCALIPGPQAKALTVADLRKTRDEVAKTLQGSKVPLEHIRLKAFEQTLKNLGRDDPELAVRLTTCYLEHRFTTITLYPDVIPALSALRGSYRLGLVTNGNTYPERCGLPETFAFTVFAQDHGVQKPQPQFYEWVLSEASALPHEIIHVGDSLRNDVYGAQAVGIRTIWVNRHQWRNETDVQPFAEITSLEELPKVLTQCAS
jgi:putative hydrolase of the HAD superfamily